MPRALIERLPVLALAALLLAGTRALALPDPPVDKAAREDDPAELREQVLYGEHNDAVRAAIELFSSGKPRFDGKNDATLRELLRRPDASAQARRSILEALGIVGRDRADVACRIARLGLSDADAEVRDAAASALAGIERREVYAFLLESLRELTHAPQGSREARELETIVGVVERKHDPIAATGVLVDALPVFDGAEEQRLHDALKRLTGRSFPTHDEWRRWYDDHKKVPQREWYLEVLRGLEDSNERAQASAERLFEKLLASLSKDETALLRELEEALGKDSLPQVRACAIKNLGLLGAKQGATGDRATALLEEQVKQRDQDELTLRAALVALGRTGRQGEVAVLVAHMEHASRAVRLAAAAGLGALRGEGCVQPLLKAFQAGPPPIEAKDPEAAVVLARALGSLGRDPEGRCSAALLSFVARVSSSSMAAAAAAPGSALLQAGAEALGGVGPALAPESETASAVVSALARLSDPGETQDVRWWAATSLGRVPHRTALAALARSKDEALNVRRAAIGSIGLQARRDSAPEDLLRDATALLADQLLSPEDALKRAARTELELTVASDTSSFAALSALASALQKRGEPDLAATFLEGLPAPDKLTEAQKKSVARYWVLLEARAESRLRLSDGKGALQDFESLLAANGPAPARQRALTLGRARALLATGEARAASDLAARLARADPKDDESWTCVRTCAETLLGKGERTAAHELLASLEKPLAEASPESQARVQETLRRATAEPKKSEGEPQKPEAPHPGAGP